jgi:hypothetical protein
MALAARRSANVRIRLTIAHKRFSRETKAAIVDPIEAQPSREAADQATWVINCAFRV